MLSSLASAFSRFHSLISGSYTLGDSRRSFLVIWGAVVVLVVYPAFASAFRLSSFSGYFIWTILAMSLSLVWGYAGILSLGHIAFFGLGGYIYGIVGINLLSITGGTQIALIASLVLPALVAIGLGYFMFYGRVSGIYVAIITLAVTLLLEVFLTRASGSEYTIGEAALGGYGGMSDIPSVTLGFGANTWTLGPILFYYFIVGSGILIYFGLRILVNSSFGYRIIAIRENETRTELFGYDIRKQKLIVFALSGGMAGFAGALYAAWGNFISPPIFGMLSAILPIIWVMFGGYEYISGAVIGAVFLQWLENELTALGSTLPNIILGSVFILVILYLPGGIGPNLLDIFVRVQQLLKTKLNQMNRRGEKNNK